MRNTIKPAILIEVCFCDSKADVDLYHKNFEAICAAIVKALTGACVTQENKPQQTVSNMIYRVAAGSYANKENADKQVKKLKEAGFDSFIIATKQ